MVRIFISCTIWRMCLTTGVDNVSSTGFTFGADHGCAFGDAAQSFAEIARAADERNFEGMLIDMVGFVGGGEHFGFVDVLDAEFLQNLKPLENVRCGTWPSRYGKRLAMISRIFSLRRCA